MLVSAMRTNFKNRLHGLASALTDIEIDVYLEQTRIFEIPNRIGGMLSNGSWSVNTTSGNNTFALDWNVHSVYGPVYVDGDAVHTYTRRDQFWADYDADTTDTGPPQAVLVFGASGSQKMAQNIITYPKADGVYVLSGQGRLYPSDKLSDYSEIYNDTYAFAIIAGAAREFALDNSEDEVAQREGVRFEDLISQLRSRSHTPALEKRYRRTF